MIFLTENIWSKKTTEVIVYDSLEDVAQRVDWQDILDGTLKILDEEGNIYVWDDSKRNQVGTIFHYSFKKNGKDIELAKRCKEKFIQLGRIDNFEIKAID